MSASTRWLAGVVAVVLVIVVLGLVAALRSRPPAYAPDSPEYTVQQYVQAVADRDATRALSYLSPELRARCSTIPREAITNRNQTGLRATLQDTTRRDDTATVRVQLTETFGDAPFGSGESNQTVVFELQRSAEGWLFSDAPWPVYCPPVPKPIQ